jgi:hypothetical protein
MVAYLTRMPAGIPGEVISIANAFIEPQETTAYGVTGWPDAYGIPLVIDASSGKVRKVASGDSAIRGILVRPYPTNAGQDALGVSTPPADGSVDVCRVGKMSVKLSGSGAAAKGGTVYVWKSAASGSHIQGGFEAADPSSDGFSIPATFDGPADTDNIVTISYNI